jgi:signal transduction histidine kinase
MKMLAKRAEDRYHTAARLESELRRRLIEWEARQQIDDSTEQGKWSPGHGALGLSICRSIIDGDGGRLWAETNEHRGAVFQFTLSAAGEDS